MPPVQPKGHPPGPDKLPGYVGDNITSNYVTNTPSLNTTNLDLDDLSELYWRLDLCVKTA
jgi:hypothetical protein